MGPPPGPGHDNSSPSDTDASTFGAAAACADGSPPSQDDQGHGPDRSQSSQWHPTRLRASFEKRTDVAKIQWDCKPAGLFKQITIFVSQLSAYSQQLASPSTVSPQGTEEELYRCDGACGFQGPFKVVEAHETTCPAVFPDFSPSQPLHHLSRSEAVFYATIAEIEPLINGWLVDQGADAANAGASQRMP